MALLPQIFWWKTTRQQLQTGGDDGFSDADTFLSSRKCPEDTEFRDVVITNTKLQPYSNIKSVRLYLAVEHITYQRGIPWCQINKLRNARTRTNSNNHHRYTQITHLHVIHIRGEPRFEMKQSFENEATTMWSLKSRTAYICKEKI